MKTTSSILTSVALAVVVLTGCTGEDAALPPLGSSTMSPTFSGPVDITIPVLASPFLESSAPPSAAPTTVVDTTPVVDSMTAPTVSTTTPTVTSLGSSPGCSDYEPAPSTGPLRLCHQGTRVAALQQALGELGFGVGTGGVDAHFGPSTELAVRRFQCSYGLEVDGLAGPATLTSLDLALEGGDAVTTVAQGCDG